MKNSSRENVGDGHGDDVHGGVSNNVMFHKDYLGIFMIL